MKNNVHFRWTQWRKNTIIDNLLDTKEFNRKYSKPSELGIKLN